MKIKKSFASKGLLICSLFTFSAVTLPFALQAASQDMKDEAKLSSSDKSFFTDAAEGGQAEVEFAKLALKKSSNSEVRAFANRMITDHTKANAKLKDFALSQGVKFPDGIGVGNNAEMLKLKVLSGDTFDKSYVSMMLDDHQKDVAAFKQASQDLQNEDLRKIATKTLPTLQEHLSLIEDLNGKIK